MRVECYPTDKAIRTLRQRLQEVCSRESMSSDDLHLLYAADPCRISTMVDMQSRRAHPAQTGQRIDLTALGLNADFTSPACIMLGLLSGY
jgi:hypothetical protein